MSKLNLLILLWEKLFKNKQKQLKIPKKKVHVLVSLKSKEIKPIETKPNEYSDYFLIGSAKIRESFQPVDFYHVIYDFKDLKIPSVSFSKFKGPLHTSSKSIYKGYITLEYVEKEQEELKAELGRIKQGDPRNKSPEQKKTINNIKNLYNSREKVVQMFNDYAKNMSRNIYHSKQGTGLKILTHKQLIQRLIVGLVQTKAGSDSESLLNEIR